MKSSTWRRIQNAILADDREVLDAKIHVGMDVEGEKLLSTIEQ
jgi:hypothetical protein